MNQLHKRKLVQSNPLTAFEERARSKGYQWIAGVDEAGRGPLAGPVVAAACILPKDCDLSGVDDSKKLTEQQRAFFYNKITSHPGVFTATAVVACGTIDVINILQASLHAMALAIQKLAKRPDYVIVDGPHAPKIPIPVETVIDADALSLSVAAASIVAKYTRDQIMKEYHQVWPVYGFDDHKGYGTEKHRKAMDEFGLSPIHRRSFAPVRKVFLS